MDATPTAKAARCAECGTEIAPALLACPGCRRLVHAAELGRLKSEAETLERAEAFHDAVVRWRAVLERLPRGTTQHTRVSERIDALTLRLEREGSAPRDRSGAHPHSRSRLGAIAASVAAGGLLVWKFKFVLGFVLTKGKLLLLGLTKWSTLLSMLLSTGVYWTVWGWPFALGLVLSIYVHEIGHVAALRRLGIRASAPMFVPGLGAFVRGHQYPASAREDARVGLAGPIWGLGAAVATWGLYLATAWAAFAAIARVAAWINLFNLLPVWQLDGGRGFRALAARERGWIAALIAAAWFATGESLLLLLALAAVFRVFTGERPATTDRRAFVEFALLVAALSALTTLAVPGIPLPGAE